MRLALVDVDDDTAKLLAGAVRWPGRAERPLPRAGRSALQPTRGPVDARRVMTARPSRPIGSVVVLGGLGTSAAALALAPVLMPAGYSWVSQTTSESAAQGTPGAWLARLGFALFGASVLLLVVLARGRWGGWALGLHAAFGTLLIAAAAFSHRSWIAGVQVDRVEDTLHSVAATGMGFAFAAGVAVVAVPRTRSRGRIRALDVVALVAPVAIPLGMVTWPEVTGVLQRVMFGVAYAWFAVGALAVTRERPRAQAAAALRSPASRGTSGSSRCG